MMFVDNAADARDIYTTYAAKVLIGLKPYKGNGVARYLKAIKY